MKFLSGVIAFIVAMLLSILAETIIGINLTLWQTLGVSFCYLFYWVSVDYFTYACLGCDRWFGSKD